MELNQERWQESVDKKLDVLTEVLEKLARIDERMLSTFRRMDAYDETQRELTNRLIDTEKRVADMESKNTGQVVKLDWFERLFWIVIVGGVTILLNVGLGV